MIEKINAVISGAAVPCAIIAAGIFFCIRLRAFWLMHPVRSFRALLRTPPPRGGISPLRALCLSLAGTLGVGNIVGVSAAIYRGGPGAIVWMLIAALAASALKYAETYLASLHRRVGADGQICGGAPYYIRDILSSRGARRVGAAVGGFFALLCLGNSLSLGCVVQVNAVSGALCGVLGADKRVTGAVFAVLTFLIVCGGLRRISAAAEALVPPMTVGFFLLSAAVLIRNAEKLPAIAALCLRDAFSWRSAAGGAAGFFFSDALRHGVMRGLLSNEAGAGTSPLAHASGGSSPEQAGMLSVVEVTVDTVILCTMTAAVILISGDSASAWGANSVMMTVSAYSAALGPWAAYALCAAVVLFGFATVICQSFYGLSCVRILTENHPRLEIAVRAGFTVLFSALTYVGAAVPTESVWGVSDLILGVMTLINVSVLLLGRREVRPPQ